MSIINYTDISTNIVIDNKVIGYDKVIDNKLIYYDLSGTSIVDNSFNLFLELTINTNSIQKCNVLFRNNNGLNPIIHTLVINNIPNINLFLNNRDTTTTPKMTNQEFIITDVSGTYTSISTIRKYN